MANAWVVVTNFGKCVVGVFNNQCRFKPTKYEFSSITLSTFEMSSLLQDQLDHYPHLPHLSQSFSIKLSPPDGPRRQWRSARRAPTKRRHPGFPSSPFSGRTSSTAGPRSSAAGPRRSCSGLPAGANFGGCWW